MNYLCFSFFDYKIYSILILFINFHGGLLGNGKIFSIKNFETSAKWRDLGVNSSQEWSHHEFFFIFSISNCLKLHFDVFWTYAFDWIDLTTLLKGYLNRMAKNTKIQSYVVPMRPLEVWSWYGEWAKRMDVAVFSFSRVVILVSFYAEWCLWSWVVHNHKKSLKIHEILNSKLPWLCRSQICYFCGRF